jgi:voltage-gated potassium channel
VFHIADELAAREDFSVLPPSDLDHLSADMRRAFATLLVEWTNYMAHLKNHYPYLFSMAVRKSPFSEKTDVIIR